MPGLSNGVNNSSRQAKGRQVRRRIDIQGSEVTEPFTGGTASFNVSVGGIGLTNPTGTALRVESAVGITNEYAYKTFTLVVGVNYTYSIDQTIAALALGNGCRIKIGNSAGDGTYIDIAANTVATYTGVFTPTQTAVTLSLTVVDARANVSWDNILITET